VPQGPLPTIVETIEQLRLSNHCTTERALQSQWLAMFFCCTAQETRAHVFAIPGFCTCWQTLVLAAAQSRVKGSALDRTPFIVVCQLAAYSCTSPRSSVPLDRFPLSDAGCFGRQT